MGAGSEWIEANNVNSEDNRPAYGCEAHDVGISPQEDCCGTKGEMGKGQGWEEEGGIGYRTREEPATSAKASCSVVSAPLRMKSGVP